MQDASAAIDATTTDGKFVVIKRIEKSYHPFEIDIQRYLSSPPLSLDPRNHCAPLLDTLDVPDDNDIVLAVMPLYRYFNSPPFLTIGEAVDFFNQIFEVRVLIPPESSTILMMCSGHAIYAQQPCCS